jgi:hypothetical protein
MLRQHEDLRVYRTEHEKAAIDHPLCSRPGQIGTTDRKFAQLVYELQVSTEEEIRIVEGEQRHG